MMKSFFKKLAFVMALAMVVSMVAPAAKTVAAAEDKKPLAIAYQKGAVITALNLAEVGATEDLRFVYAPENWKELGATWSSSNPNVVTVDKDGVVEAKAAGTATVSVAVGSETASIEVYSVDMTTFVATMGNKEDRAKTELTLKVGEEFDFAFYGIKDYSVDRYNCEWWAVDPEGVIDLNTDNGLVTAKKAGTAKLTLAVMNLVTLQKTDVAACVITVEEEKPAVDPNNFEITKLISDSKFELTFENKAVTAEEVQKGLSVYYYVGNQRIQYNYPKVVEVKDGVVDVEFHQLVSNNTTYGFVYAGIEKEYTVKIGKPASMYLTWQDQGGTGHWNVAYAGYNTQVFPHILNEEGTDITNSVLNTAKGKVVEYKLADYSVAAQFYMQGSDMIYFTAADQTAVVVATFYNGFDELGQRVESISSAPTAITSTTRPIRTFAYQNVTNATVNGFRTWNGGTDTKYWWDNVTKLAVGDTDKYFAVNVQDNYGNWESVEKDNLVYTSEIGLGIYNGQTSLGSRFYGKFSFESDNIGVFTIDSNGHMIANRAGQANVLVYYDPDMYNATSSDKVLVTVVPVTTYDRRYAASFTFDNSYKTVSTEAGDEGYNVVKYTLTIKDQLGEEFNIAKPTEVYIKSKRPTGYTDPEFTQLVENKNQQGVHNKGKYDITVTCTNANVPGDGSSRPVYFGVKYNYAEVATITANIVNPKTTLQAGNYAFDAWTSKWHNDASPYRDGANHTLFANLYVYKNGVKVEKEPVKLMSDSVWYNPANADYDQTYVKVLKNGIDVTQLLIGTNDTVNAVTAADNKVEVKLTKDDILVEDTHNIVDNELGAGSYTVLAYKAVMTSNPYAGAVSPEAMQLIASTTVEVTDSKTAVSYAGKRLDTVYKSTYSIAGAPTQAQLDAIAKDCFVVKVGDHTCRADWASWKKVLVNANALVYNDNTIYFESLEIYVPINGVDGDKTTYVRYEIPVGDYVITR